MWTSDGNGAGKWVDASSGIIVQNYNMYDESLFNREVITTVAINLHASSSSSRTWAKNGLDSSYVRGLYYDTENHVMKDCGQNNIIINGTFTTNKYYKSSLTGRGLSYKGNYPDIEPFVSHLIGQAVNIESLNCLTSPASGIHIGIDDSYVIDIGIKIENYVITDIDEWIGYGLDSNSVPAGTHTLSWINNTNNILPVTANAIPPSYIKIIDL